MLTKVINEEFSVLHSSKEIARQGRKALIITGRFSAKRNGALMELQKVLQDTGTEYVIYDKIEENPSVETIMEARDIGISKGADFCIGLGGGSPMDAAKAVAILLFHSDRGADYLYEKPTNLDMDENGNTLAYPVIEIPTTCGTGSEVTGVSVLTRHDLKTKKSLPHRVYPVLALLDPRYLMHAPYEILRNTAIDAMAHFIESYINTNATEEIKQKILAGLKLWSSGKEVITGDIKVGYLSNPDMSAEERVTDLKILSDMLTASMMAGEVIAVTGTSLPHALSYRLTYQAGIAHGPATGIFQPGFMSYADEKTQKALLRAMDFRDLNEFREFLGKTCDIKGISDLDYSLIIENSIKDILSEPARMEKVPYPVNREVLENMVS